LRPASYADCLVSQEPDRVEVILEAACAVIARHGVDGLRMEAVAHEAGVSKALVHYYFSTRRQLLRATFTHSEQRSWARVEAELALAGSGAERVERFLLLDLEDEAVFLENRALWSAAWSSMRMDRELRPLVEASYRAWVARLVELVEEGRADGSIGEEARAEDVALRLAALIDGAESLGLLGLVSDEKAQAIVRGGIEMELRQQAVYGYRRGYETSA
jgi:AcrR family transcriptional regulator